MSTTGTGRQGWRSGNVPVAPAPARVAPLAPQEVVVTGGAGYLGSHLVDSLAEAGHRVRVIDDLSSGSAANLARHASSPNVALVPGSILDAKLIDREIKTAGTVFHLAAAVGVRRIVADPLGSLRANVTGTENVLGACARHGAAVVLASSSEVYGKPDSMPMSESGDRVLGPTTVPRWSYATAKALDEHLAFAYGAEGLRAVVVRYFNSYGPRLGRASDASVIGVFIRRALAGEPLELHDGGRQTRCFTYVSDTVRGTVLAAAALAAGGVGAGDPAGQVFNIGSDVETSVADVAAMIVSATSSRSAVRAASYEDTYGAAFEDIPRRVPDISRARAVLGWEPEVPLAEGLKQTIAWWGDDHE